MTRRVTEPFRPEPPDVSSRLWHLVESVETELSTLLDAQGWWFARLAEFGDIDEGTLPSSNLGLLAKAFTHQRDAPAYVVCEYSRFAKQCFASCWTVGDPDPSDAAWEAFGCGGEGAALRSNAARMKAVLAHMLSPDGPAYLGKVRYVNYDSGAIPDTNMLYAAFAVRNDLSYEREVRVVIALGGNGGPSLMAEQGAFGPMVRRDAGGFVGGHADGAAIVVRAAPADLIEQVMIGDGVDDELRAT